MKKLLEMLSYRRPAGSKGEREFINRYIKPWRPKEAEKNLIIEIPGDRTTMFSCHTDTVHRDDKIQQVCFDENMGCAFKDDKEPLGGDDTVGVWLLLEMIKAKIPGIYMFHYGEEKGCIGSKAMARKHPKWASKFDRAVAFDRRGTTSIITHQMSDRCCSDVFGNALKEQLKNGYELDTTGLYTDTARYMELIPECTNISVGYNYEHGPNEIVDVEHALLLAELVKGVKWAQLPVVRDPKVKESKYSYGAFTPFAYGAWKDRYSPPVAPTKLHVGKHEEKDDFDKLTTIAQEEITDYETALAKVKDEPELAAQILLCFTDYFFGDRLETTDKPDLDHIVPSVEQPRLALPAPALPPEKGQGYPWDEASLYV